MTLVFFFLQKSKNRNRKKNRLQFALWWWLWALWWQTILLLILIYLHIFRTRICVSNDPEHFFCYIHQVSEVSDKVRTNVKQKIWPIWHWCERMMDIDYHWCVRLLYRFFFWKFFIPVNKISKWFKPFVYGNNVCYIRVTKNNFLNWKF